MSAVVNMSTDSIQILSDFLISGNREQLSLYVMQGWRHVPHRVVAFSPEGQDLEAGFCKGYAFKYVMDCL